MLRHRPELTWHKLTHPHEQGNGESNCFIAAKSEICSFLRTRIDDTNVKLNCKPFEQIHSVYIPLVLLHFLDAQAEFLDVRSYYPQSFIRYYVSHLCDMALQCATAQSAYDIFITPYYFIHKASPNLADYYTASLLSNAGDEKNIINEYLLANHIHDFEKSDGLFLNSLRKAFENLGDIKNEIIKRVGIEKSYITYLRLDYPELLEYCSATERLEKLHRDIFA